MKQCNGYDDDDGQAGGPDYDPILVLPAACLECLSLETSSLGSLLSAADRVMQPTVKCSGVLHAGIQLGDKVVERLTLILSTNARRLTTVSASLSLTSKRIIARSLVDVISQDIATRT